MTGSLTLTNCLWWTPSLYCNTCTNISEKLRLIRQQCECLWTRTCMFKVPRSAGVGISIRPCVFAPLFRSCSEESLNPSLSVWSLPTVWRTHKLQVAHTESAERESTVRFPSTLFKSRFWRLSVCRVQIKQAGENVQLFTWEREGGVTWCFGDGDGLLGWSSLNFTCKEESVYLLKCVRGVPLFNASS